MIGVRFPVPTDLHYDSSNGQCSTLGLTAMGTRRWPYADVPYHSMHESQIKKFIARLYKSAAEFISKCLSLHQNNEVSGGTTHSENKNNFNLSTIPCFYLNNKDFSVDKKKDIQKYQYFAYRIRFVARDIQTLQVNSYTYISM